MIDEINKLYAESRERHRKEIWLTLEEGPLAGCVEIIERDNIKSATLTGKYSFFSAYVFEFKDGTKNKLKTDFFTIEESAKMGNQWAKDLLPIIEPLQKAWEKESGIRKIGRYIKVDRRSEMYERLKSLKFYHPDDEAGELFASTCSLCYKMYGLGETEKAELLFGWAKEQAQESKEWSEQEGMELDDFITGDRCC